jgi:hypothetical protein
MGGWCGDHVQFRDKDLFADFKDASWMALFLYGITGRTLDAKQVRLFEGLWVLCTSYPDVRIWNNRVAALAGTARSTATLGLSAATAVSEAIIYGHRPLMAAMQFLLEVRGWTREGAPLQRLLSERLERVGSPESGRPGAGTDRQVARLPGYGRPIAGRDERIPVVLEFAQGLGYGNGEAVKLAFAVEQALKDSGSPLRMNVAALMAALAIDQGLQVREYYHYVTLCFSAGALPCYIDALHQPEGSFFPLRCTTIQYHGRAHRRWRAA